MTNLATSCSKKVMWRNYSFEFRYLRLLILSSLGFAKQLKLKQVGGLPTGTDFKFYRYRCSHQNNNQQWSNFSPTRTINRWRNTLLLIGHGAKQLLRYEIFLVFGSQTVWIHVLIGNLTGEIRCVFINFRYIFFNCRCTHNISVFCNVLGVFTGFSFVHVIIWFSGVLRNSRSLILAIVNFIIFFVAKQ